MVSGVKEEEAGAAAAAAAASAPWPWADKLNLNLNFRDPVFQLSNFPSLRICVSHGPTGFPVLRLVLCEIRILHVFLGEKKGAIYTWLGAIPGGLACRPAFHAFNGPVDVDHHCAFKYKYGVQYLHV